MGYIRGRMRPLRYGPFRPYGSLEAIPSTKKGGVDPQSFRCAVSLSMILRFNRMFSRAKGSPGFTSRAIS